MQPTAPLARSTISCRGRTRCVRRFVRTAPSFTPGKKRARRCNAGLSYEASTSGPALSERSGMRVEGLSPRVRSTDVDPEFSPVVYEAIVVDAEPKQPVGWHFDRDAAANGERRAVSDSPNQRAGENIRERRAGGLAARLGTKRCGDIIRIGAQLNFAVRVEAQHLVLLDRDTGRGPRLPRRYHEPRSGRGRQSGGVATAG